MRQFLNLVANLRQANREHIHAVRETRGADNLRGRQRAFGVHHDLTK